MNSTPVLRLSDFVPASRNPLVEAVEKVYLARLSWLASALAPGVRIDFPCPDKGFRPFLEAAFLICHHAERGEGKRDKVEEAHRLLSPWPWEEASDPAVRATFGLLLSASRARLLLDRGESLPIELLALLASVTPHHVRLCARKGEFTYAPGMEIVAADQAKNWLFQRGLQGLRRDPPSAKVVNLPAKKKARK